MPGSATLHETPVQSSDAWPEQNMFSGRAPESRCPRSSPSLGSVCIHTLEDFTFFQTYVTFDIRENNEHYSSGVPRHPKQLQCVCLLLCPASHLTIHSDKLGQTCIPVTIETGIALFRHVHKWVE